MAMVLTRGLSMEQQKSSRDSLQFSSSYSTKTNTSSFSEDTIPSQGEVEIHTGVVVVGGRGVGGKLRYYFKITAGEDETERTARMR
ncbi:hypothetical protein NHX12_005827 [Muraenolepis orangiensis]|uniref:Uncharacterized protein n=1 Tax=Muraenolepis orangiensis TaxID=630683 RepID=A0A9Q0DTV3_9TELE|nr:hypothetical protein NHX12_005827 [Muraenolepis orangiensis]